MPFAGIPSGVKAFKPPFAPHAVHCGLAVQDTH